MRTRTHTHSPSAITQALRKKDEHKLKEAKKFSIISFALVLIFIISYPILVSTLIVATNFGYICSYSSRDSLQVPGPQGPLLCNWATAMWGYTEEQPILSKVSRTVDCSEFRHTHYIYINNFELYTVFVIFVMHGDQLLHWIVTCFTMNKVEAGYGNACIQWPSPSHVGTCTYVPSAAV